jgi:hypothetical protein
MQPVGNMEGGPRGEAEGKCVQVDVNKVGGGVGMQLFTPTRQTGDAHAQTTYSVDIHRGTWTTETPETSHARAVPTREMIRGREVTWSHSSRAVLT